MRGDAPFLVYRDATDAQRLVQLAPPLETVTVGRRAGNDVALEWDGEVSRVHATLERIGDDWTIADDGLSRNGTYVNGIRITGRRRLRDRDALRFGNTLVVFRMPVPRDSATTLVPDELQSIPTLTETQVHVLEALCRPYKGSPAFATPARNRDIAEELYMSVEGVKSTLRGLFHKFGIEDLPQNEKRVRLVELAFQTGIVSEADL